MEFETYLAEMRKDPEYLEAEKELRPFLEFADDVLETRLERGWTQTELARRAGTDQANISRIESALANPTIAFMQKIAQALDAEVMVRLRSVDDLPQIEASVEQASGDVMDVSAKVSYVGYQGYFTCEDSQSTWIEDGLNQMHDGVLT